jgi:Fe-S-cluster containining protein
MEAHPKPVCIEGCSRCCRELTFPISGDEKWVEEFGAFLDFTRPGTHKITKEVLKITIPCTHLDEKGKCKIYEDRPDICRNFYCKKIKTQEGEA